MNTTKIYKDRIIGLLFLGAFLFYSIGRNLFESQNNSEQIIGSFLIILNSIVVVYIGIFLRETIKSYHSPTANISFYKNYRSFSIINHFTDFSPNNKYVI